MQEDWKEINGYFGDYLVSSLGRVKSIKRSTERILSVSTTTGYGQVNLCSEGYRTFEFVHDLVAGAFLGSKPTGLIVNHKDGNKLNNCVDNLEYVSYSCNNLHAYNTGLKSSGERHCRAILTEDDVRCIRERLLDCDKVVDIASDYGVSSSTISLIKSGKNWKQVS